MKNTSNFRRILFALALVISVNVLMSSSCSKNDDVINSSTTPIEGSWKVSYYFDSGDETSHFTGYTFQFNSNGSLVASNGSSTVTGSWSQTSSKLTISFGADPLLSDLADDWLIEEKTATSIKLKDDNVTNGERLQFTKL